MLMARHGRLERQPLGLLGTIGGQPFRRTTNDRPASVWRPWEVPTVKRLHIIFIPRRAKLERRADARRSLEQ